MKKILLTGASGFIGQTLLPILASEPNSYLLCLSRKKSGNDPFYKNVKWVSGDLDINKNTIKIIRDFNPNVLIHMAWEGLPDYSLDVCVNNMEKSIKFCNKIFDICKLHKVISIGSCWEAGKKEGCIKNNDWSVDSNFIWSKQAIFNWLLFQSKTKGFIFNWARLFYVYGPHQREQSLLPFILENLYSNGCLPELRNPQESLDFIHVYDVSTALKLVLDKSSSSGVINIGNGKVVSVSSIADYIYKLYLGEKAKIQDTKYEIQNEVRFWADISDLQKEFRWKPKFNIENGLKNTFDWYKHIFNV